MELLGRAEARLLEDVPVIPVFFRVSKRLVRPDLRGVSANPLGHVASRYLSFCAE
jgi:ABC-type oligopeptide transport system substrate-binding subunit